MSIKIQTMKLNLNEPYLTYTEPSKIWEVNKIKLEQFDFFKNLFNFNKKEVYELYEVSDKEMELFLDYINNIDNYNVKKLNLNEIMLLIKLSDFLIIPNLLNISVNEFFKKL
tara:strand:- start:191 stop:526 length:336 start_codon:yes stop_codon:yes gene_type:complete